MQDDNQYADDPTLVPTNAGTTDGRPAALNVNQEQIAHELLKDALAQQGQLYQTEVDGNI